MHGQRNSDQPDCGLYLSELSVPAPDRRIFVSLRGPAPLPRGVQITLFGADLSAAVLSRAGTHREWLRRGATRDHECSYGHRVHSAVTSWRFRRPDRRSVTVAAAHESATASGGRPGWSTMPCAWPQGTSGAASHAGRGGSA